MTATHVTLETTYSTSIQNKSESLHVSEGSVTKTSTVIQQAVMIAASVLAYMNTSVLLTAY